eukprot:1435870-Prymnesium_polylepis.1
MERAPPTLPSITELTGMLQTETDFASDGGHAAFFSGLATQPGRKLFCYNCDTQGHVLFDCPKSKVHCEECGERGHITKHCYVRNDKALPSGMNTKRKQQITAKRAAYQAGKSGTGMTAIEQAANMTCQYIDEDENFIEMMRRDRVHTGSHRYAINLQHFSSTFAPIHANNHRYAHIFTRVSSVSTKYPYI